MAEQPFSRVAQGVGFPDGLTAAGFLHGVLREAAARYSDVFSGDGLPEAPAEFRRRYGELLVRFEALRASAARRGEIARFILGRVGEQLRFRNGEKQASLEELLAKAVEPARIQRFPMTGAPATSLEVSFGGRTYRDLELVELAEHLRETNRITRAGARALEWITRLALERGLDLRGEKFVVMGAGAELAPTPLLLAAGATVLWIDVRDPGDLLARSDGLAGTLAVAPEASDLLSAPQRIAATIREFAADEPVHLGLFAYSPGGGREWRLAAAMNAITQSLPPELVHSVSLFISPTSPLVLEPEDVAAARGRQLPRWQALLARLGVLEASGPFEEQVCIARTVVPLQGASYQGAQYVSKILMAETCALHGSQPKSDAARPLTVSANVAGVSSTRSMQHPVFQAAFLGAPSFDLVVFEPETTRMLSGLLMLHDLLNAEAPGNARGGAADPSKRASRLFSQQLHGGLYSQPLSVHSALRIAALLGFCRKPRLLLGLR